MNRLLRTGRNLAQQNAFKTSFCLSRNSHSQSMASISCTQAAGNNRSDRGGADHGNGFSFLNSATRTLLMSVGALGLLATHLLTGFAENCGIVGVVSEDSSEASDFLIEGLTILKNRGYDSAGMASLSKDGKNLVVTKYASQKTTSDSIDRVAEHIKDHAGNSLGIAHTRWATHGGKTDANAHPHTDSKNRVAVVHNGTINSE